MFSPFIGSLPDIVVYSCNGVLLLLAICINVFTPYCWLFSSLPLLCSLFSLYVLFQCSVQVIKVSVLTYIIRVYTIVCATIVISVHVLIDSLCKGL